MKQDDFGGSTEPNILKWLFFNLQTPKIHLLYLIIVKSEFVLLLKASHTRTHTYVHSVLHKHAKFLDNVLSLFEIQSRYHISKKREQGDCFSRVNIITGVCVLFSRYC